MLKLVTGDSGKMQWKQEMQLIEILDSLFGRRRKIEELFFTAIYIYINSRACLVIFITLFILYI